MRISKKLGQVVLPILAIGYSQVNLDNSQSETKTHSSVTVNEKDFLEEFGDAIRSDVFPGKDPSARVLKSGDPVDSFYFLDNAGQTILLFEFQKDNVKRIYSPRGISQVLDFSRRISPISPQLSRYLDSKLNDLETTGRELGYIEIDNEEQVTFVPDLTFGERIIQHDLRRNQESLEELLSLDLNMPLSQKMTYGGSSDEVVTVVQKEYAIVDMQGEKRVTNTWGLADCIGLTLYDSKRQIAAIAHIDGTTDVEASIKPIFQELSRLGGETYEARLFGGYENSAKIILTLINELKGQPVKIVETDILNDARDRSIGISADGKMYNNIFTDGSEEIGNRLMLSGLKMNVPLVCVYKP